MAFCAVTFDEFQIVITMALAVNISRTITIEYSAKLRKYSYTLKQFSHVKMSDDVKPNTISMVKVHYENNSSQEQFY
ncbi:hypothetical protein KSF78_0001785 [Schistosoma japonicum]|nr:hypothetical protein KSF78_0001785 [Schistosoma japonicum]